MRKNIKQILAEYGAVALVVHFTIAAFVFVAFWVAIRTGWRPAGAAGDAGALAAAYVAYKLTQPVRIAITLVLTPFVAKAYERVAGRRGPKGDPGP